MANHVRLEIDGKVEIDADVDKVTLSRDFSSGAFTLQGGSAGARTAGQNPLLQGLTDKLKSTSRASAEQVNPAPVPAEAK